MKALVVFVPQLIAEILSQKKLDKSKKRMYKRCVGIKARDCREDYLLVS